METELKFALSPEARRKLERQSVIRGAVAAEAAAHSDCTTYFDTSDLALRKAGFSLRIRHSVDGAGGKFVQTVKATGSDGARIGSGLRRQEWEWPIPNANLDLGHLDEVPGLPSTLNGDCADLQPLFRTEVQRCQQTLRVPGGGMVELALDDGMIVTDGRREPLNELELELKEGSEEALLRLGLDLAQAAPLSLQLESKAERGYCLQDGQGPKAHKAADVVLDRDAAIAETFGRLCDSVLEHLLGNQPAALRGEQAEGVHQMRVAVRRLRSLLMLYEPLLEPCIQSRFQAELRRLADCLGAARDWDVFLDETLPQAAADGLGSVWIEPLATAATAKRHAAHQAAKKAIGSPSFTRFVLSIRTWSRYASAALMPGVGLSMKQVAPQLLDRLEGKLAKRLARVDRDDAASLHAMRKSAKKLRYDVEYFDAFYGHGAKRYAKACNALQKKLGVLNDLETASRLAMELVRDNRLDLAPAAGALSNYCRARRPKLVAKALKARARFARRDPFW